MTKRVLSARIDERDVRFIDGAAAYLGMKRADLVEEIIRQFISRNGGDDLKDWMKRQPERGGSNE